MLDRDRASAFLSSTLFAAGLFALFLFLAFYFQADLGYSPGPFRAGLPALQRRFLVGAGFLLAAALSVVVLVRTSHGAADRDPR